MSIAMATWNSLPIRASPAAKEMAQSRKESGNAFYHPMSSPLLKTKKAEQQQQVRDNKRQEKLRLEREKIHSRESDEERRRRLDEQAAAYQADIDVLVAEEEEQQRLEETPKGNDNQELNYEEELEDFLTEADLELEAQLKAMNIT